MLHALIFLCSTIFCHFVKKQFITVPLLSFLPRAASTSHVTFIQLPSTPHHTHIHYQARYKLSYHNDMYTSWFAPHYKQYEDPTQSPPPQPTPGLLDISPYPPNLCHHIPRQKPPPAVTASEYGATVTMVSDMEDSLYQPVCNKTHFFYDLNFRSKVS